MNKSASSITLTYPSTIHWVKDSGQIVVVDEKKSSTWILHGFDAAVWDYLMLGYSYPKLIETLYTLLDVPIQEVEEKVAVCIRTWQAGGLLEAIEVSHV
jgi:hypothetical protein